MKKYKIINIIFLILTILYMVAVCTIFYDYSGLFYTIGLSLYKIGFICWVISNYVKSKKKNALFFFAITCVISTIITIIYYIQNIVFQPSLYGSCLLLSSFFQKLLFLIISIKNINEKKCIKLSYALVLITALLNILNLFNNGYGILDVVFVFISFYMALYVFYFNKGFNVKSFRNIILILTAIIIIFVTLVLFHSSFIDLIKLKNTLNDLNGETTSFQETGNRHIITSLDNKKKVQINVPNKFKELSYFNNKSIVPLSLDGNKPICSIAIGQNPDLILQINNLNGPTIEYNNRTYGISSQTILQSLFTDNLSFALVTPIDSQYYYTIMFTLDNYNLKTEDLETLLDFKIIK